MLDLRCCCCCCCSPLLKSVDATSLFIIPEVHFHNLCVFRARLPTLSEPEQLTPRPGPRMPLITLTCCGETAIGTRFAFRNRPRPTSGWGGHASVAAAVRTCKLRVSTCNTHVVLKKRLFCFFFLIPMSVRTTWAKKQAERRRSGWRQSSVLTIK